MPCLMAIAALPVDVKTTAQAARLLWRGSLLPLARIARPWLTAAACQTPLALREGLPPLRCRAGQVPSPAPRLNLRQNSFAAQLSKILGVPIITPSGRLTVMGGYFIREGRFSFSPKGQFVRFNGAENNDGEK